MNYAFPIIIVEKIGKEYGNKSPKGTPVFGNTENKTLCLDLISESYYEGCMDNRDKFKDYLIQLNQKYPELFPKDYHKA